MTLETAVTQLVQRFGKPSHDPKKIANVLRRFGAPNDVPDNILNRLMKAGAALRALGVN